jgi:cytidylate kinase
MERKERDSSKGYLFVVGGPGGSGCSVISRMLAKHFNLRLIYAGKLFRDAVRKRGYEDFEDFYISSNKESLLDLDREVDRRLIEESDGKDLLFDSKAFAGIAHIKDIPCTVKIWLTASLNVRALRHLGKQDIEGKGFFERFRMYIRERKNLKKRWKLDKERYFKLYGVDYTEPELYNDIVIDSSNMNEEETFNLILKKLENGQYLKK